MNHTSSTASQNYTPIHIPVLLDTIISSFEGIEHSVHIDGTTGLGGHLEAMLQMYPSLKKAIAIDMDLSHLTLAKERLEKQVFPTQISWVHAPFEDLTEIVENEGVNGQVSSILLDLGLCSAHVDMAERGFSFLREGPLDMRFDTTSRVSASTIIHSYSEEQLADIFWKYGEERYSRRVARAIVLDRKKEKFETTKDLAEMIARVIPSTKKQSTHPATKIFQALRIAVNDELGQIERVIGSAFQALKPGGRIAIITYHSLEDRIVKHAFKDAAKVCICPTTDLRCTCTRQPAAKILTKKPILPSEQEIHNNSRARSAKLRLLEKLI